LRIVLTTNQVLRVGLDTPVTFQLQQAGKVTLPVPMGAVWDSTGWVVGSGGSTGT
jgi:hypothetical protein